MDLIADGERQRKMSTVTIDREAIQREIAEIEAEEVRILEKKGEYKKSHLCEYCKPWGWQKRAIELIRDKSIVVIPASNDIGKTCLMANIVLSWVYGYEAWTKSGIEFEGSIKVDGSWYRNLV